MIFYDPDRYLLMGYMGGMLGSVIFAIGMIVYGITALNVAFCHDTTGSCSAIGLISLLSVAASVIAMLVSGGSDYAGTQKVAIMFSAPPIASAILWIALGVTMRPRGNGETGSFKVYRTRSNQLSRGAMLHGGWLFFHRFIRWDAGACVNHAWQQR